MYASDDMVVEALWRLSRRVESRGWLPHTVIKVRSCAKGGLLTLTPFRFNHVCPMLGFVDNVIIGGRWLRGESEGEGDDNAGAERQIGGDQVGIWTGAGAG